VKRTVIAVVLTGPPGWILGRGGEWEKGRKGKGEGKEVKGKGGEKEEGDKRNGNGKKGKGKGGILCSCDFFQWKNPAPQPLWIRHCWTAAHWGPIPTAWTDELFGTEIQTDGHSASCGERL